MSGVTELDLAGEKFIASWEGGQSSDGLYRAYWDPFGHIWTLGIGETEGVHQGMVWTPAQAWNDLHDRFAREYAPYINALGVELNHNQFNAAASAIWNLGPGSLEWDWGRALKAGDFRLAAQLLLQYDRAGGVTLEGLETRRRGEAALMLTPEPKPVDLYHYADYPTDLMHFDGKKFDERKLAERIDKGLEHPRLHHHELTVDLSLAQAAKKRIWVVSVFEPPNFKIKRKHPDWSDKRGSRYQWWVARIKQMEKALA